jgi:hypothetical protein
MHGGRIINANNFIEGGQRINAGECTKLMCDMSDGETPRADEVDSDLIPRVGSDDLWGAMSLSLSQTLFNKQSRQVAKVERRSGEKKVSDQNDLFLPASSLNLFLAASSSSHHVNGSHH